MTVVVALALMVCSLLSKYQRLKNPCQSTTIWHIELLQRER